VIHGQPEPVDATEPGRVAQAAPALGLRHVVITSVTRDDLPDGGASHFAACVVAVRRALPSATVELLIPDLAGDRAALDAVLAAGPDILNHNLETVPGLYGLVRPQAVYRRSLDVLRYCKEKAPGIFTKTGVMVGLGESEAQLFSLMDDARAAGCDILTIGQYLRPSVAHLPVQEYVPPERFDFYKEVALQKGFRAVASGPLVRSSYRAEELFAQGEACAP
jgi:lipoic acid synthetase